MEASQKHPAHIVIRDGVTVVQTVSDHSRAVAKYASAGLEHIGLFNTAYLAGLLHDMGKCTDLFKSYIEKAANGEDVVRGSVNHTFCGVIYLIERYCEGKDSGIETLTGEIIAYAVGAHHGQFDCVDFDEKNGFEYRLEKDRDAIFYDEAVRNYLNECAETNEIDKLFGLACDEIRDLDKRLREYNKNSTQYFFSFGFVARMVLSAVIEGDRRNTAEFQNGKPNAYILADNKLWENEITALESKIDKFDKTSEINKARSAFSEQCKAFAKNEGGIYRLDIPTGGGKTLATLRYAFEHARLYNKKRVVVVIPLLTVIEQNSKVVKEAVTDEMIITEHHSNVIKTRDDKDELDRYELLTQTWETPIVVTTLVQLLNTLFGGTTTEIRRLSALCDSVIIIDEVQSLPKKTVDMFNTALNFIAYFCNSTIVLSSATHPCFDITKRALVYSDNADIIPYDKQLFDIFKRTDIIDKTTPGGITEDELADFAKEIIGGASSLLIVCNTKKSARQLFDILKRARDKDCEVYHLSTSMCMRHREDTLKKIKNALDEKSNGKKVICVSTQLIEAGVDISFNSVIRVTAGMDNVIQTAGRCNRNGEFNELCKVYIVNLKSDNTSLSRLPDIRDAKRHTENLLYDYKCEPEKYDNDIAGKESINEFYMNLYRDNDVNKQFQYPCQIRSRSAKLYNLLSANTEYTNGEYKWHHLNQAFKTAGKAFKVFDDNTEDVIVPYNDEAKEIIADLCSERAGRDIEFVKSLIGRAKPYTVNLFNYQYMKGVNDGLIFTDSDKHYSALNIESAYDTEIGVCFDSGILI